MSYVLGLDLGTSGLKGLVVSKEGKVVYSETYNYPILNPKKGYSEQNPQEWFDAAKNFINKLRQYDPEVTKRIEAISFSGQMHSLVLLDKNNEVIRDAILWNDVRTTNQCEFLKNTIGPELLAITKNKPLEGFTLPKILWVKENEPENYRRTKTFLLPKDYLGFCFTGNIQMEYSDAAGTLLLDLESGDWSYKILEYLDISSEICPKLVQSTEKIGIVSSELAKELGLNSDVKVFAGGADNACAAIGAGIIDSSQVMASIGTSGVILSPESISVKDYDGELHYFNHVLPNEFYSMGVTLSAGSSLNWFKREFGKGERFNDLLAGIDKIDAGSNGLIFTPYLVGERTPYTDSNIRGSFIGIDINHTHKHFVKAVVEGITFSLRDCLEIIREQKHDSISDIVSIGGASKNKDWLQIQADIFDANIQILNSEQGPAMGAAMIAAVGNGWFTDFKKCAEKFVSIKETFCPEKENVKKYNELYEVYRDIYGATNQITYRLSQL